MKDTLQISVDSQEEGVVMYLPDRVDIKSSPDLRNHLLAVVRKLSPPETIIIDLNEVSSIDTSGIATLIEGFEIARIARIAARERIAQDLHDTLTETAYQVSHTRSNSSWFRRSSTSITQVS